MASIRISILFLVFAISYGKAQQREFREAFGAMGCQFEIVVVDDNKPHAKAMIDSAKTEIFRIEKLISSWDNSSMTSRVNDAAGDSAVHVSRELYQLIDRSKSLCYITKGAFNITFASMADVWNFADENRNEWPDSSTVAKRLQDVNIDFLELQRNDFVFIKNANTRIGFGGIGKGYAADMAAKKLQNLGVENGVINASGDLFCWGKDAQNSPWKVAIADPQKPKEILMWLEANNQAIVTSGDYEKYKMHHGVRYAHIIDPSTGYPVRNVKSVTIVAPKAEMADALATAIFVMGVEKGIAFVNNQNSIECIIIDEKNKTWYSSGISTIAE